MVGNWKNQLPPSLFPSLRLQLRGRVILLPQKVSMIYLATFKIHSTNMMVRVGKVMFRVKQKEQKQVELTKITTVLFQQLIRQATQLLTESLMSITRCKVQPEMQKDLFKVLMVQSTILTAIMEI